MAAVVDFNTVLEWVGIATAAQCTNVRQNIGSVEDLSSLTAKDISDLVDNLRRRTTVAHRKYNMPLVVVVVCSRYPGRKAYPNYEALGFQPRTVANPDLDSGYLPHIRVLRMQLNGFTTSSALALS